MAGILSLSPRDRNVLIAGVVAFGLAGAYGYFLWMPAQGELAVTETKVAQLDSSNAKAKKSIPNPK